jgi:hypothetical protein
MNHCDQTTHAADVSLDERPSINRDAVGPAAAA